ncbi:MAG TPA: 50S ribosomal protein L13 [Bacilli bacterium]|jgi:large subunit ribosomal protein L13|nr:50S ribosomal protein L13 [Bacilli bacterium]HPZ24161.1 50S ribosomal protein L13 [Bacilli bacterium]HQC83366.1 50S ribosomal protein L13 [Bacilli bacterium]
MKSTFMENSETVKRNWYVIDATDITLGRLATRVAGLLRGKGKVTFTPHMDCGDYVIVINANKVRLTGKKLDDKNYYNHSGFPGGLRVRSAREMIEKYPVEMIERAVGGMLPNGRLGRQMSKKLFVYAGPDYEQKAQKPVEIGL